MKVLVTGTSAGIGRATAELFLERGHEVWGFDVQAATLTHPGYTHHVVDVRRPQDFPAGIKPEIIINNAGVQDSGDDLGVNLRGTINVTEFYAFGRRASDGWGTGTSALLAKPAPQVRAVVNVGSASGHTGSEFPEYAASKGGVIAYTKNVAGRLAPQGTCNSIDPGGVLTPLNQCVMDDPKLWERIMDLTPMRCWATAEEIAEWIYFVAVTNRFMTGQNLLIDGGEAGRSEFIWPEESGEGPRTRARGPSRTKTHLRLRLNSEPRVARRFWQRLPSWQKPKRGVYSATQN